MTKHSRILTESHVAASIGSGKRSTATVLLIPLLYSALACSSSLVQRGSAATAIHRDVEAVAAGGSIEGRRAAILGQLRQAGLEGRVVMFDPPQRAGVARRGANIVAHVSKAPGPTLLLGAHYDDVGLAQGVIDNAAGVGVVLALAKVLSRDPLKHYSVDVAFFDLEENGLLGSRAMAADSLRTPLPAIYVNFDVFGYGDALWVGSVESNDLFSTLVEESGRKAGLKVFVDSLYPDSDHESFRNTSSISYAVSLLDAAGGEAVLESLRTRSEPSDPPLIFRIIHTTNDTLDKLDAQAVARGVDAVEKAIRKLDARGR